MKRFMPIKRIVLACFFLVPLTAHAGYEIKHDFCSPVGGTWQKDGDTTLITTSNMHPYGNPIQQDLDILNTKAGASLAAGSASLNAMSLYNCEGDPTCGGDARLALLLSDKAQNYVTAGFLSEYETALSELREAIKVYAFLYSQEYSGALVNLKKAITELVSVHLTFADEFLIDALYYRFSMNFSQVNLYLAGQIALLESAAAYYKAGFRDFLSLSLTPVVGSSDVIGEMLGPDEWHLFSILTERFSLSCRERAAKQRALAEDPDDEIQNALAADLSELYVQVSVLAAKMGEESFSTKASFLLTNVFRLTKQLAGYRQGLNPLGYNDLHSPLLPFGQMVGLAEGTLATCAVLENKTELGDREFDREQEAYETNLRNLNTSYCSQLSLITGCVCPGDLTNSDQIDSFQACVADSGLELFELCPLELSPEAFDQCMDAHKGVIGDKYRQIKSADINLEMARNELDTIGARIKNHNERTDYQIQVYRKAGSDKVQALKTYQENVKGACRITKTKEKNTSKTSGETTTTRLKGISKSFLLRDDQLDLQIESEIAMINATTEFEIAMANDPVAIKDLMLQQGQALLAIDAAVNHENALIASFDGTFDEKENLLNIWNQNRTAIAKYKAEGLPSQRLLLNQAMIALARELNKAAHFSYLSGKALEYKYAIKLENEPFGGGEIHLPDVFKCQNSTDFQSFINLLKEYDTMKCQQPNTFATAKVSLSVAQHILGLTNAALQPIATARGVSVEKVRYEKFQEFVKQHLDADGNLRFKLQSALQSKPFSDMTIDNAKIYSGPHPCAGLTTIPRGMTASIHFYGYIGGVAPNVEVTIKGLHSLLKRGATYESFPVDTETLYSGKKIQYTQSVFPAFVQTNPYGCGNDCGYGEWNNGSANMSPAAQDYEIVLNKQPIGLCYECAETPFEKLSDIRLYYEVVGENRVAD